MSSLIEIEEVSKVFDDSEQRRRVTALEAVSFGISEGEFVSLLGPSGCGKTTLLNLIAGFDRPSQGTVCVRGNPVLEPGPDRAVVFQESMLFPWLTVAQSVAFGLKEQGMARGERRSRARAQLDLVGLAAFADTRPHELSGGMKQRVAIARALAMDPAVLLMDEPFCALDTQSRERLQDELLRLWSQTRKTILFVTHNVDEATYLADRVLVFTPRPGRVQANETVSLPRPRSRISESVCPVRRKLLTELKAGANGTAGPEPCCGECEPTQLCGKEGCEQDNA